MVSAAVYLRLSDEDRNKKSEADESESIQNQKSLLTDYCRQRNWDIFDIIVTRITAERIFTDLIFRECLRL